MTASTFRVGDKVHVEFTGTVVEPYYAGEISDVLAHQGERYGWLEVEADGVRHVAWVTDLPTVGHVTRIEPEYETGAAYADATGRVYIRRSNISDEPWLAPSGIHVSETRPHRPMTRLVPEERA